MKKIIIFLLFTIAIYGQIPQGMSHRGTAYNTNGVILQNTQISIRVRILNGSGGTAIYTETYSLTTNNNGHYNFNIGFGQNPSTQFSSIDWSNGNKWLEIGIDPNNGTNYSVIGSNQLMSVPYALYSEKTNSNNSLRIVNNIDELRSIDGNIGDVVYAKGHTIQGDGGDGVFMWKNDDSLINPTSALSLDNDGIIIQSVINGVPINSGRWVRQYSGYINVNYFGVKRGWLPSGFSNSDKIQKIIDFAYHIFQTHSSGWANKLSDMTIHFPNGTYFIDKPIILKDRVKIVGGAATLFVVFPSSSYDYMIKIDEGPIVNCEIDNIMIDLNNRPNIGGIYLRGIGNPTGGIWMSKFKNINILKSEGHGIFLEGGKVNSNYNLPNQFLVFENVRVERSNANEYYNSLRITGQQGQITFLNCTFDGTLSKGINVFIGKENDEDLGAAVISFINSTVQSSEYGVLLNHTENITFDNCWFEDLDIAFEIRNSKAINILNSRFANAAGFGSNDNSYSMIPAGYGRCISSENSAITVENNYVTVTNQNSSLAKDDKFIIGLGNNNVINVKNNSFQDIGLSTTSGIMQTTTVNSSVIDISSKKLIFINNSGAINKINSTILAGETIFIRANMGPITFIEMNQINEGNIYLNNRTALTLQQGQTATFIKIDNEFYDQKCTYQLVNSTETETNDSNWISINTFNTNITNFDLNSLVRFRKKENIVFLDGVLKGGVNQTNGTTYLLFTLPEGYRPNRKTSFVITRANTSTTYTVGRIDVDSDGKVYGVNYSNLWNSLSGISFLVN